MVNGYGAIFGRALEMALEQRRLAGVWITDEADFGDDAKFQPVITFGAVFAGLSEAWCLAARGGEISISQSAASTFAQNKLLPVLC